MFPYVGDELDSKPQLNLASDGLKKQNNLGMPLTSMQTFQLFIKLPFILKKLLHSSNFLQCHAILICVDILSLCFAVTITEYNHKQMAYFIKLHNDLLRKFDPDKTKFNFHFMTHFPDFMKDLRPLAHTSCLATERNHHFFKGNKVRNLKHVSLMPSRRDELRVYINDYCQDGSLSRTALSGFSYGRLDDW